MLSTSYVAGLGDTIVGQEKTVMTTRRWRIRAPEEIKLGQNEANSEDSSVLLQEIME